MFFRKRMMTLLIVAMCLVGLAGPAPANVVPYGDRSGDTIDFINIREESATDEAPLYGNPTINDNNVLWFPVDFTAHSVDGITDETQGSLKMTLRAADGFAISGVRVTEIGNYSLSGQAMTAATSASLTATLTVGTSFDAFSAGPYQGPDSSAALFNVGTELDFTGLGLTQADFTLDNWLLATSEVDTEAFIRKSFDSAMVKVEFYTNPVPLPGALWLLGSGLCSVLGLRRLRMKKGN